MSAEKTHSENGVCLSWTNEYVGSVALLGFRLNPGTLEQYVDLVAASISRRRDLTVLYHNLHSLHEYLRSAQLRRYFRGSVVLVDGMPLIGLLKLAGRDADRTQRVTYVDFIWPLLQRAERARWRVFIVGQSSQTLSAAFDKIRARLPGIELDGHDGFFDKETNCAESLDVIDRINAFGTDLLLVGMGTPIQERWISMHRDHIDAPAVLASGACMEYVAGVVQSPPRWMGRCGLEWSFRLLENPRRFAYRYLVEPWVLASLLMRNLLVAGKSR